MTSVRQLELGINKKHIIHKLAAVCNYYYINRVHLPIDYSDKYLEPDKEFEDQHIVIYKSIFADLLEGKYGNAERNIDWLISEFPACKVWL